MTPPSDIEKLDQAFKDKQTLGPLPTLGRIVIITWPDGISSPAVVTRTADETHRSHFGEDGLLNGTPPDRWGSRPAAELEERQIDVMVLGLVNTYPLYGLRQAPACAAGHWSWPERR